MDGDLIERARAGDADSFDELARSRIDQVYSTALGILGSPPEARDTCQEALVSMWRGLPRLRDPASFDGWLYRITVNAAKMSLRRRRGVRELHLEPDMPSAAEMVDPDPGDRASNHFDRAFERLAVEQRALLLRHHLDGASIAELARQLEVPEGTRQVQVAHRAGSARARAGRGSAMTHAGEPLTDEQLRRQLDRRVSVAPLTPDDRTNLIRAARLPLSEPARPFFGPHVLGWVAGIAAVTLLALITIPLLQGSAGQPSQQPTLSPNPTRTLEVTTTGVSLDDAIAIASEQVQPAAELWSYAPGRVEDVMQKILGAGAFDQPPAGATRDTLVWAIAFKVDDHLTTVYLDLLTGAWLENRDTAGQPPAQHHSDIVIDEPLVRVSNGTTLELEVFVNGESAGIAQPQHETVIDPRHLGEAPWHVVARTTTGRQLVVVDVNPRSIYHTTGDYPQTSSGQGDRADLSCGRLDVWVGIRPMGPMPPASFPPHDCDP